MVQQIDFDVGLNPAVPAAFFEWEVPLAKLSPLSPGQISHFFSGPGDFAHGDTSCPPNTILLSSRPKRSAAPRPSTFTIEHDLAQRYPKRTDCRITTC
jgi:hypothetical protein